MSPLAPTTPPDHALPDSGVFDLLPHGVALTDPTGTVVAANWLWERALDDGDPVVAPLGSDLLAHLRSAPDPANAVADHIADGLTRLLDGRGSSFQVQYELEEATDPTDASDARWFLVAAEGLPGGGLVITRTDTTVHHGVNEVLAELAFHDDLTGLPNRGLVLDRIRMALIRAQRLGLRPLIVFTDLDGFKEVNDEHGHEAGDAVLVEAAQRLDHAVREVDTCGRWGGDEFVLVIELGAESATDRVVDRLRRAFDAPFTLPDGTERPIGISIGATLADGRERVDVLVDRADRAMYRAKRERSGPVLLGPDD
ncbi:diguanylate cyclase [Iamia majanohamensis]|uniref:Diguanylate cyclase n=1 Tax=Iamia majanohamensis TaxID=467976 RepID=A0AAE9Y375_9ACTN|nr:sensor domain-containing diguanylate cyclase [Iamia majanohamensis]WCO65097.1 diguanylate cyclase [Iamia majanohamensis]